MEAPPSHDQSWPKGGGRVCMGTHHPWRLLGAQCNDPPSPLLFSLFSRCCHTPGSTEPFTAVFSTLCYLSDPSVRRKHLGILLKWSFSLRRINKAWYSLFLTRTERLVLTLLDYDWVMRFCCPLPLSSAQAGTSAEATNALLTSNPG